MTADTVIRVSSLPGYSDCSRRAIAQILRREIEDHGYQLRRIRQSIGGAIGTGVHASGAMMLSAKMIGGDIPSSSQTDDCGIAALRERVMEDETSYDDLSPSLNTAELQVRRMSRIYREDVVPKIMPVVVEERFEARIPWSKVGIVLSGQGDVLARTPEGKVHDTKTGARLGHYTAQIGSYSTLYRSHGHEVSKIGIDFIRRTTMKKDQERARSIPFDAADCEASAISTLKHIDMDIYTWRAGDDHRGIPAGSPEAFLANPSSNMCSEKWCAAYGTAWCSEWKQGDE